MPRVHPLCRTSRIEKGASCPRSQWRHGGLAKCYPTWMRAGTADDVSHEERGPRCWRRARSLAFLVAFAFAFLPGRGEAQYYAANISPAPYPALPLPNGQQMTVHGSGVIQGFGYHPTFFDIELPFPVFFYGQQYRKVRVHGQGLVAFDTTFHQENTNTTRKMRTIPGSAEPHNFIAAWWDQIVCNNGDGKAIHTQVVGNSPNRQFVIEWDRCRRYASNADQVATFQVRLTENSDEIEIYYGPIVAPTSTTSTYQWAGTIGVENADGSEGTMVLEHCAPACTHDDFPTDHVVRFTSGASLRVEGMEAERTGYAGRPLPLRYTLANVGSKPAEGFTVQYWVSRTPEITPESFSMGYDERTWTLDGRTSTTVTAAPRIPIEVEEGDYYVLVEADPHYVVQQRATERTRSTCSAPSASACVRRTWSRRGWRRPSWCGPERWSRSSGSRGMPATCRRPRWTTAWSWSGTAFSRPPRRRSPPG